MARFLRAWGGLLAAPWGMLSGAAGMAKVLIPLVPASAITLLWIALAQLGTVPFWTVPLAALIVAWLAATAGVALERSRGPWVAVSELRADDVFLEFRFDAARRPPLRHLCRVFYVVVTNGPIRATPCVKITEANDATGHLIEHGYEGHWRGHPPGYAGSLLPGESTQIGLVCASVAETGEWRMFIWAKGDEFHSIAHGAPADQGAVTLKFLATCYVGDGAAADQGETRHFAYQLIPDPASNLGYKIAPPTKRSILDRLNGLPGRPQHWRRAIVAFGAEIKKPGDDRPR